VLIFTCAITYQYLSVLYEFFIFSVAVAKEISQIFSRFFCTKIKLFPETFLLFRLAKIARVFMLNHCVRQLWPIFKINGRVIMAGQPEHNNNAEVTLKLAEEKIALTKQKIVDGHVRVTRSTTEHDEVISTLLTQEKVEVKHVAKAQPVETMPEIREENGVLIVPVVEEEIEIVRKLVLKEEIHIRKVQENVPFQEVVTRREQQVNVERDDDQIS